MFFFIIRGGFVLRLVIKFREKPDSRGLFQSTQVVTLERHICFTQSEFIYSMVQNSLDSGVKALKVECQVISATQYFVLFSK
jgi:hypothetical protein